MLCRASAALALLHFLQYVGGNIEDALGWLVASSTLASLHVVPVMTAAGTRDVWLRCRTS